MVLLKGFIFRAVKCIENGPQGWALLGTAWETASMHCWSSVGCKVRTIMEVWHLLQAEEVVRAGFFLEFCAPDSESVSPFHLFQLSLRSQQCTGGFFLFACWVFFS